MATPEVYFMQCDNEDCQRYLPRHSPRPTYPNSQTAVAYFQSRKAARTYASMRGWYIGDEELCPECAAKRGKHGNA